MVLKHEISLLDDFDGEPAERTLCFSFDGKFYEIDLSSANLRTFKVVIEPYVQRARCVRRGSRGASRPVDPWATTRARVSAKASTGIPTDLIRATLVNHGIWVGERGAISKLCRHAAEAFLKEGDSEPLLLIKGKAPQIDGVAPPPAPSA